MRVLLNLYDMDAFCPLLIKSHKVGLFLFAFVLNSIYPSLTCSTSNRAKSRCKAVLSRSRVPVMDPLSIMSRISHRSWLSPLYVHPKPEGLTDHSTPLVHSVRVTLLLRAWLCRRSPGPFNLRAVLERAQRTCCLMVD